jgi:hypothetical protein
MIQLRCVQTVQIFLTWAKGTGGELSVTGQKNTISRTEAEFMNAQFR